MFRGCFRHAIRDKRWTDGKNYTYSICFCSQNVVEFSHQFVEIATEGSICPGARYGEVGWDNGEALPKNRGTLKYSALEALDDGASKGANVVEGMLEKTWSSKKADSQSEFDGGGELVDETAAEISGRRDVCSAKRSRIRETDFKCTYPLDPSLDPAKRSRTRTSLGN